MPTNYHSIKFEIPLPPVTKKNSQQIIKVGNYYRIIPSKAFRTYEKDCMYFMPNERGINYPVNVKATYYMKTRRKVDLTNLHEALHDVLVTYGVLEDDDSKIIVSTDGSRVKYDKDNPRTVVEISEVQT